MRAALENLLCKAGVNKSLYRGVRREAMLYEQRRLYKPIIKNMTSVGQDGRDVYNLRVCIIRKLFWRCSAKNSEDLRAVLGPLALSMVWYGMVPHNTKP